jgi:DNA-directed RNA polymerase specialized sigma24 family protein
MSKNSHRETAMEEADKVIARHEGKLLGYAMRVVGDSHRAQNLVEKAFIQVLGSREKQCGLSSDELTAELYRVIYNAAIRLIPSKKRCSAVEIDAWQKAMEAVRGLEPMEQQIVILKIFECMTNQEISRITLISEEKVAILLCKSVIKVADELKKAGLL